MNALLEGLKALGPARLAALAVVALGMLSMLALMVLRGGTEPMALLYGDLDLRDSAQVVDQLGRHHIAYQIGGGGGQIMVSADQVPAARVMLAEQGLPGGGTVGYELFDRGEGFAPTDFQEQVSETRALEGELVRTIRAVRGVRNARVHLVLPRRDPFARDQQDAQAGVLLTLAGAAGLDREGVQAILNLLCAAVPGLHPQNVSIIDSRGDLLARAGQPTGDAGTAMSTEEVRQATELRLDRAVEEMLERTLGPGRVRAEASVRMNFDHVNETHESFDPDQQVTRSTQTVNTKSKTTEATGAVTVQNNLPNADAGNTGAGSQESRDEETTNYEIGKTVRTLIHEQPQIDRISLAVLVDGSETTGPDGKEIWKPRTPEELDRITTLVKSAIGFDAKRGDQVDVVSMRFAGQDQAAPAQPSGLFAFRLDKADLMHLAQTALIGIVGLLALLLVLRPMVARLTTLAPGTTVVASLQGPGGVMALAGPPGSAPAAALGAPPTLPLLEDESMVNIAQIEGQMRASSLRKITELVEKHPEETLSIMRGWMVQENG
ncbi:MAG TPA: flagellar basal-body MS-ring/collar protein FliF [Acetobacteraceae bacterium]|jgi:flagellar M-ring protein FliF